MASFLDARPSPSMHRNTKHYDWRVLDFIDLQADSCQDPSKQVLMIVSYLIALVQLP